MPREIGIFRDGKITLTDDVEEIYEKIVLKDGNGAKVYSQKKYLGRRAYVIILKD